MVLFKQGGIHSSTGLSFLPSVVLLALVIICVPTLAAESQGSQPTTSAPVTEPVMKSGPATDQSRAPQTAVEKEASEVREGAQAKIAELQKSIAGVIDSDKRAQVQHEIERIKADTELQVLYISLDYATTRGDEVKAQELLARIDQLMKPAQPKPDQGIALVVPPGDHQNY